VLQGSGQVPFMMLQPEAQWQSAPVHCCHVAEGLTGFAGEAQQQQQQQRSLQQQQPNGLTVVPVLLSKQAVVVKAVFIATC